MCNLLDKVGYLVSEKSVSENAEEKVQPWYTASAKQRHGMSEKQRQAKLLFC